MVTENKVSKKRKNRNQELNVEMKTEENQVVEEKKAPVIPKVTFSAWFEEKVKKKKLRYWQEEALEVFMGKQGLSVLEVEDKYEEAFKKF